MQKEIGIDEITSYRANDFERYYLGVSKALALAVHEAESAEKDWFELNKVRTTVAQTLADIVNDVQKRLTEIPTVQRREKVPLWEKFNLTIDEATVYFEIGEQKLRYLVRRYQNKDFYLTNGKKVLIKRVKFEQFLNSLSSI